MEGYERTCIRKELDNDDPFPDLQKVRIESESSKSDISDTEHEVKSDMEATKKSGPGLSAFAPVPIRRNSKTCTEPPRFNLNIEIPKNEFHQDEENILIGDEHSESRPVLKRSASFGHIDEEKTPKQECIAKLKELTQRIKMKVNEMKAIIERPGDDPFTGHDKDFIEDLFDQYVEDICGRVDFLSNAQHK